MGGLFEGNMTNITLESLIAEAHEMQECARLNEYPIAAEMWHGRACWLQTKLDTGEQIVAIPDELVGALREWRRWHFPDDHDSRGYEQDLSTAIDKYLPKEGK
jgi:hypothetical protein